jgi:hypothetical protein
MKHETRVSLAQDASHPSGRTVYLSRVEMRVIAIRPIHDAVLLGRASQVLPSNEDIYSFGVGSRSVRRTVTASP